MSDPVEQLAEAAATMRALLAEIAAVTPVRTPVRYDAHRDGQLRIWQDTCVLQVHTMSGCADYDAAPTVFLAAGPSMQWRPDWTSVTPAEARELAQALLAAADDADAHPKWRQR